MRIALVVGWWYATPPIRYGGVEMVVGDLADELVRRGHDVFLLAPGDSRTSATLLPYVDQSLDAHVPGREDWRYWEAHYQARCLAEVGRLLGHLRPDIVHNHLGDLLLPYARDLACPMVTTEHWQLDVPAAAPIRRLYAGYPAVAISRKQMEFFPDNNWVAAIHHGLELSRYTFRAVKGDYFAFLGRTEPSKGLDVVCRLIKETRYRLKIAARIDPPHRDYFEREVRPLIDGEQIEFLGEVDTAGRDALLGGARALLSWLRWHEPFGLVYPEANACGTPVIVNRMGSTPELIEDGVSGFLVDGPEELRERLDSVGEIDPQACRRAAEERFPVRLMADRYLDVYRRLVDGEAALAGR